MKITSRTCNLSGLRKQPTCQEVVSPRTDELYTELYTYSVSLLRFGRCFWSVLPRGKFTSASRGEALPKPGQWHVTSLEFLRSFLRRHFLVKPAVVSRNVGFFSQAKNCQNYYNLDRTRVNWTDLESRSRQKGERWDVGWEFSKFRK